ncbi:hypothetical protein DMENIID0001_063590 [Sergentomyia squamirostris]
MNVKTKSVEAEFAKKLVNIVREFPCLYDKNNKGFTNPIVKRAVWEDVAKRCRREREECERKFKEMMDIFEYYHVMKTCPELTERDWNHYSLTEKCPENFALYDDMSYLKDYINYDRAKCHLKRILNMIARERRDMVKLELQPILPQPTQKLTLDLPELREAPEKKIIKLCREEVTTTRWEIHVPENKDELISKSLEELGNNSEMIMKPICIDYQHNRNPATRIFSEDDRTINSTRQDFLESELHDFSEEPEDLLFSSSENSESEDFISPEPPNQPSSSKNHYQSWNERNYEPQPPLRNKFCSEPDKDFIRENLNRPNLGPSNPLPASKSTPSNQQNQPNVQVDYFFIGISKIVKQSGMNYSDFIDLQGNILKILSKLPNNRN